MEASSTSMYGTLSRRPAGPGRRRKSGKSFSAPPFAVMLLARQAGGHGMAGSSSLPSSGLSPPFLGGRRLVRVLPGWWSSHLPFWTEN